MLVRLDEYVRRVVTFYALSCADVGSHAGISTPKHCTLACTVACLQVMAASLVEDKVQSNLFMTPFRSPAVSTVEGEPFFASAPHFRLHRSQLFTDLFSATGSPEAQGKTELLMAVISSINKWQGYTIGASRMVSHVAGSLSKHRRIIHEVCIKKIPSLHQ